jgi:hypothetical protein
VNATSPFPTTIALAHCPGRVDIVSRVTPACEARGGEEDRGKEFKPEERNDGRGRAERRERRRRWSGSMSGQTL